MSTVYHPPLEDLEFLLWDVLDVGGLLALPGFAHADRDVVRGVLFEGAKFAQEVLSPINGEGDAVGARLAEGRVEFPPGYAAAYSRYARDGWLGLDIGPKARERFKKPPGPAPGCGGPASRGGAGRAVVHG